MAETWSFEIPMVTSSLCQVSHSHEEVKLFYNVTATSEPHGTVEQSPDTPKSTIPGLKSNTLTEAVGIAAAAGNALFGSSINLQYAEQPPVAITKLIASRAGGDYDTILSDPVEMSKAAKELLSSLVVQVGYQVMKYTTEGTVAVDDAKGQIFYAESRLKMQNTSPFLIIAVIPTMLVIMAVLCYLRLTTTSGKGLELVSVLAAVLRPSAGFT